MPTKSLAWPEHLEDWPSDHSNAAQDRNDAAMYAARISYLSRRALEHAADGTISMRELLYLLAKIDGQAVDICRLMERNGAPTRPMISNGDV